MTAYFVETKRMGIDDQSQMRSIQTFDQLYKCVIEEKRLSWRKSIEK